MARRPASFGGVVPGGLLAIILVAPCAEAETRLGLWGGASLSRQHYSELDESVSQSSSGRFTGGLLLDVDLGSRLWVRLAPGWLEKGTTLEWELFQEPFRAHLDLGYVELPVLLGWRLTSGPVHPYLLAGPSVGYLARARATGSGPLGDVDEDVKDYHRNWDFGVTAGGGLALGSGRTRGFVEGRYTWGLVNVSADEDPITAENRSWQFTAGVTVGLGR